MRFLPALTVLVLACTALLGCGGDGLSQVGGTVKVDGKLLSLGEVTFHPTTGGRRGSGPIRKDGSYVISYLKIGDGMPPGTYKVTIVSNIASSSNDEAEDGATLKREKLTHLCPKIYNSVKTTPLTLEITGDGSNDYDLDLSSK
jgi:hypothetical protein